VNIVPDLKSLILAHQHLELLGQRHVIADVLLQAPDAVCPEDEPKLERPEAATQWDAVVAVVHSAQVLVAQVQGIHIERALQVHHIPYPQGGGIEVRQKQLVGVRVEGVGVLQSGREDPHLGQDEGVARVGAVHVQPNAGHLAAHLANLRDVVEGAAAGGAHGGHHEEGRQSGVHIVLDGLAQ